MSSKGTRLQEDHSIEDSGDGSVIKGMLSNVGPYEFWIMSEVLLADGKIREDREEWLNRVTHVISIVIILKPNETLLDHPYDVSYKTFRSLSDAQRALKQDSRPVCIISDGIDDPVKETWAFSETILSQFSINVRSKFE